MQSTLKTGFLPDRLNKPAICLAMSDWTDCHRWSIARCFTQKRAVRPFRFLESLAPCTRTKTASSSPLLTTNLGYFMKPNVFAIQREIADWGVWYAIWKNGWQHSWTIWVAICINRHEDKLEKSDKRWASL